MTKATPSKSGQRAHSVLTDSESQLMRQLRDDAIFVHPPPPPLDPPLRALFASQ